MYDEFKYVYCDDRYVNPKEKSAKTEWVRTILDCGFDKEIIYVCVFKYSSDFATGDNIMI